MKTLLCTTLLCLFACLSFGQVTLEPDPDLLPYDVSNCITIEAGTEIEFLRSPACSPNVVITDPMGLEIIFDTADEMFSYSFEAEGEYVVSCNSTVSSVGFPAICYNVTAAPTAVVPTVSEWGVIILALLFMIFASVALKTKRATLSERQNKI